MLCSLLRLWGAYSIANNMFPSNGKMFISPSEKPVALSLSYGNQDIIIVNDKEWLHCFTEEKVKDIKDVHSLSNNVYKYRNDEHDYYIIHDEQSKFDRIINHTASSNISNISNINNLKPISRNNPGVKHVQSKQNELSHVHHNAKRVHSHHDSKNVHHDVKNVPHHVKRVHRDAMNAYHDAKNVPRHAKRVQHDAKNVPHHAKRVQHDAKNVPHHDAKRVQHDAKNVPHHDAKNVPHHAKRIQHDTKNVHHDAKNVPHHAKRVQRDSKNIKKLMMEKKNSEN